MNLQFFSTLNGKIVDRELSTTVGGEGVVIRMFRLEGDSLRCSVGDTVEWSLCRGFWESYSVMCTEEFVVAELVSRSWIFGMTCVDIILAEKRA